MKRDENFSKCFVIFLANVVVNEIIFIIIFRLLIDSGILEGIPDIPELIDMLTDELILTIYGIYLIFMLFLGIMSFYDFKKASKEKQTGFRGRTLVELLMYLFFLPSIKISTRILRNAMYYSPEPQNNPDSINMPKKSYKNSSYKNFERNDPSS